MLIIEHASQRGLAYHISQIMNMCFFIALVVNSCAYVQMILHDVLSTSGTDSLLSIILKVP